MRLARHIHKGFAAVLGHLPLGGIACVGGKGDRAVFLHGARRVDYGRGSQQASEKLADRIRLACQIVFHVYIYGDFGGFGRRVIAAPLYIGAQPVFHGLHADPGVGFGRDHHVMRIVDGDFCVDGGQAAPAVPEHDFIVLVVVRVACAVVVIDVGAVVVHQDHALERAAPEAERQVREAPVGILLAQLGVDQAHITVLHSVVVGVVLHAGAEIGIDDVIQTQGHIGGRGGQRFTAEHQRRMIREVKACLPGVEHFINVADRHGDAVNVHALAIFHIDGIAERDIGRHLCPCQLHSFGNGVGTPHFQSLILIGVVLPLTGQLGRLAAVGKVCCAGIVAYFGGVHRRAVLCGMGGLVQPDGVVVGHASPVGLLSNPPDRQLRPTHGQIGRGAVFRNGLAEPAHIAVCSAELQAGVGFRAVLERQGGCGFPGGDSAARGCDLRLDAGGFFQFRVIHDVFPLARVRCTVLPHKRKLAPRKAFVFFGAVQRLTGGCKHGVVIDPDRLIVRVGDNHFAAHRQDAVVATDCHAVVCRCDRLALVRKDRSEAQAVPFVQHIGQRQLRAGELEIILLLSGLDRVRKAGEFIFADRLPLIPVAVLPPHFVFGVHMIRQPCAALRHNCRLRLIHAGIFDRLRTGGDKLEGPGHVGVPKFGIDAHGIHAPGLCFLACCVVHAGGHDARAGQVGHNVFPLVVCDAFVVFPVCAVYHDAPSGIVGVAVAKQVFEVTDHAGNAGCARSIGGDRRRALLFVLTQIPRCGVCAFLLEQRLLVGSQGHVMPVGVKVATKFMDRLPIVRQGNVLRQHIAVVDGMGEPVFILVVELLQLLGAADAVYKMDILIAALFGLAHLALLPLGQIHNGVCQQIAFVQLR